MFHPDIYRSYDIRGVVGEEFFPEEAYAIGRAYAQVTGAKKVVVARDMRPSGTDFEAELVRGLTEAGVSVVKIGMATTPMFYFAVHHLGVDGGLDVTASHNPGQYNGIKMTRAKAVPIAKDSGLMEIRDLVEQGEWNESEQAGSVEERDVREAYIDMVCEGANGLADGMTIVVDAGNGMAGLILEDVFQRLGGIVVPLYWELDGNFPNHEANPLIEDNMKDLHAAVAEQGADLGVAFDGDADRVFFTTETGVTIPGDVMTAILAKEILQEQPGATVVYDLRASRVAREEIEAAGGRAVITRVGHSFIKALMRDQNAVFAGEVSGHFYFTPWFAESGMLALVTFLKRLKQSGGSVSDLAMPLIERYQTSPELNFEVEDKDGAMRRIEEELGSDAKEVIHLDGLTIRYDDWWCNVRPSGTEPLLRLKVEAVTSELLDEKRMQLEQMIGGTPAES